MSWMKDLKKGFDKVRSEVETGINDFKGKNSQGQQGSQQPQQQQYGQYYQQAPHQQHYQQFPSQQYYQQLPIHQGQHLPPTAGPPPPGPPPPGPRPPPQQGEPGDGPPPPPGPRPPPPGPRPPQVPGERAYWRPRFQQDIPVGVEWDAKLGNGPDGWGNQELQFYTAEASNAFHTPNNLLVLRALANSHAPNPEQKYTSARLVSRETLSRDRGALTAVILSPCAQGVWPAFWLLPQEPFKWPVDGEIDIAETWNGDHENHSCLHWGYHEEPHKHRVLGTRIPDMHQRPVRYDLAWDQPGGQAGQGRLVWYIDGRPVMKAAIPEGTRPIRDMSILLNVAMGGNVCKGVRPNDGYYDMVVYSMYAVDEPELGGWAGFEHAWHNTPDGHTY